MTEWQLGFEAFHQGRMHEAADRLERAAHDHDRTVSLSVRFQMLCFLGSALYTLGKANEAVTAFEEALKFGASLLLPVALTFNLANAYLAVGKRAEATRALQQTLIAAPGHVEATMLLNRLAQNPDDTPLTGAVLGRSPDQVKDYLRTLQFSQVAINGYSPVQVQAALKQIERYIDTLVAELEMRTAQIATQETELARFRQMEEALIQNILNAEQDKKTI